MSLSHGRIRSTDTQSNSGLKPHTGAYTTIEDKKLKIYKSRVASVDAEGTPGLLTIAAGRLLVQTGQSPGGAGSAKKAASAWRPLISRPVSACRQALFWEDEEKVMQAKKRLYVGLLGFSLIMVIGIAALVWYIFTHRDILVNQVLLIGMLVIAAVIFAVLGLGILAIVMMIIRCKSFPSLETLTQWANGMLFPLTLLTGRFFGIDKDKILKSFISVNNYLVGNKKPGLRCQDIMILLPTACRTRNASLRLLLT